ncbi:hypothetical protein DL1_16565 [Thioclava dalianensis]|uniref:Uncharacterized protein n=1 Tax=Thioclava dalianensis TaxID=1185766 RepID=A0A074T8I5_9RHOB|nr:hypothetical protein [Thioclava dalianensis]KEP68024.1 hypothetical protein DL1_16565 [Thioclava dalianensis]SFN61440.1 hypothetical protein SAMN05216224_1083 [Thioclava dalianensis]
MGASIDELKNGLERALTAFKENEIIGALTALDAVTEFLKAEKIKPASLLIPLVWLSDDVIHRELRVNGKRDFEATRMASAAAAVDLLKAEGFSVKDACNFVSRSCGDLSSDQIFEFRKNIGKGRAGQTAIDTYYWYKKHVSYLIDNMDPSQFRDDVQLEKLRKDMIMAGVRSLYHK